MSLVYKYNSSGGDPVIESFPLAAVTTERDSICYYNTVGFLTNAYTNAGTVTTVLVAGVTAEAVVNAAGAAGDLQQPIICTKDARYRADSSSTADQTDVGTNVTMDSILLVDEDDPVTDSTGVFRILKLQGAAAAVAAVLGSINYGTP